MNQADKEKYFDILGIDKYLYTQNTAVIEKINTKCLVVENKNNDSFIQQGKTRDFLLKMLSTIGLNKDDIICTDKFDKEKYNAQMVLFMGSGFKTNAKNQFITYHPSDVLKNQNLKREVWEVLKQIKQCLK